MNSTGHLVSTAEGEKYCRAATWVDVVKFFALNYGLHAFTVVPRPGGGGLTAFVDGFAAIIMPFIGVFRGVIKLYRCFRGGDRIENAHMGNALCMLVPSSSHYGRIVSPMITSIHGQHPLRSPRILELIKSPFTYSSVPRDEANEAYKLVRVPPNFAVRPLHATSGNTGQEVKLAGNLGLIKTSAAIIQIIYSSYELYAASTDQLKGFGYGAYAISTIPYIVMSFINLLASLSGPSYPSLYLVHYCTGGIPFKGSRTQARTVETDDQCSCTCTCGRRRDDEDPGNELSHCSNMIGGAVGCAYEFGNWRNIDEHEVVKFRKELKESVERRAKSSNLHYLFVGIIILLMISPYVIIALLTGYKTGKSTTSQRAWIICSLVLGQVLWLPAFVIPIVGIINRKGTAIQASEAKHGTISRKIQYWLQCPVNALLSLFLFTIVMSPPTIGMFVTVGRMILEDKVCVKVSAPLS